MFSVSLRPDLDGIVRDLPADYEDELKERSHVQRISRTGNFRSGIKCVLYYKITVRGKALFKIPNVLSKMTHTFLIAKM